MRLEQPSTIDLASTIPSLMKPPFTNYLNTLFINKIVAFWELCLQLYSVPAAQCASTSKITVSSSQDYL